MSGVLPSEEANTKSTARQYLKIRQSLNEDTCLHSGNILDCQKLFFVKWILV